MGGGRDEDLSLGFLMFTFIRLLRFNSLGFFNSPFCFKIFIKFYRATLAFDIFLFHFLVGIFLMKFLSVLFMLNHILDTLPPQSLYNDFKSHARLAI